MPVIAAQARMIIPAKITSVQLLVWVGPSKSDGAWNLPLSRDESS